MGSRRKRGQFPGLSGKLREIHLYEKGERRPKRKKSRSLTEREGGGMIFDRTDVLDKRFGFWLFERKRSASSSARSAISPAQQISPGEARYHAPKANITEKASPKTCFFWWRRMDSNHRSRRQQIYSLPPLATREFPHIHFAALRKIGAGRRTRTPDLLITNQLLYQLSYTSTLSA